MFFSNDQFFLLLISSCRKLGWWHQMRQQMALVGGSSQTGKWTYEPSVESRSSPHKQTHSSTTVPPLTGGRAVFSCPRMGQTVLATLRFGCSPSKQPIVKLKSCVSRTTVRLLNHRSAALSQGTVNITDWNGHDDQWLQKKQTHLS